MMDESSTPMHRRTEESACYTCVCVHMRVLREPPLIALAADRRHGGNILECHALEKSAADPNEASWEYGVLISAKTGAGGTRDSGERPRGGTEIVATCRIERPPVPLGGNTVENTWPFFLQTFIFYD
jgi:hypothetical protein